MYTQLRKLILASSVALALATMGGAVAESPVSSSITDAQQEARISTIYALSPHFQTQDIKVSVQNGKATLTGTVTEDVYKELAKQFALSVEGIKEVDNQIVIEANYAPPDRPEAARFGERIADATITAAVKSKLMWTRYADGLAAEVSTESGKVTLQGTAESEAAKDLAGRLAADTPGAKSVDNRLEVKDTKREVDKEPSTDDTAMDKARDTATETRDYITDSWITTKVKSAFMWSSGVSARDISVTTNDGVVSLSGKVNNEAERELAIDLAKHLRGVKGVDASGLTL